VYIHTGGREPLCQGQEGAGDRDARDDHRQDGITSLIAISLRSANHGHCLISGLELGSLDKISKSCFYKRQCQWSKRE
jgi:hypothetical protein